MIYFGEVKLSHHEHGIEILFSNCTATQNLFTGHVKKLQLTFLSINVENVLLTTMQQVIKAKNAAI